ncbi:hypothetical protein EV102420_12_01650 [Pseudescherichia vulneris NBRC 102420]|uniref:Uncharacterized protein n=1 Tax=Pseudescherichia vulneris NBRC 102420 TaxID=1115515 RepID=A0A090V5X5_PSEVU|nr:hypothetical protein [Pseudescherichia vulneris]GAL58659.1 hypothetical protein EV102420_12_01650 [Pseudescherichia vulneris NBRC 102420]STQ58760.1 Protein of uncharacterised function (DUF2574) [Pseudescherichia vulneris]
MKIALTFVASALLACAVNAQASDTATLSISGMVLPSAFTMNTVKPDGQPAVQRGVSTQVVSLPDDENRKVIVTSWD